MVNLYVNLILHYGTEGYFTGLCCYIAIVLGTISTFCTFLLPLSVLPMQAAGTVQQAGRQLALTSPVPSNDSFENSFNATESVHTFIAMAYMS